MMLRVAAFTLLICAWALPPAWAIEGMGNPWETIDDAVCAGLKMQDFSATLGQAAVQVHARRVAVTGERPGYCHVDARLADGAVVDAKLPVTGWNSQLVAVRCIGACDAAQHRALDDALGQHAAVAFGAGPQETPPDAAAFLAFVVRQYYGRTP